MAKTCFAAALLAGLLIASSASAAQPVWAKRLFTQLLSTPYRGSEAPAGTRIVGVNPFIPADGSPVGLVDITVRSPNARYDVLYDMQAGHARWGAATLWFGIRKYARAGGAVVFHPSVGFTAVCSYTELGSNGINISCAAWVQGVLVQVQPPSTLLKAQTTDVVAILRSAIAHLQRVRNS